jgi:hypothetical protein
MINIPTWLTRKMVGSKFQELCDQVECDNKCNDCIIEKMDFEFSVAIESGTLKDK